MRTFLEIRKKNLTYKVDQLVSGSSDEKIKLIRAQGGCQGTIRRRRTWQAAKSHGEPQAGFDPWMSEWGNPAVVMGRHSPLNQIGGGEGTR